MLVMTLIILAVTCYAIALILQWFKVAHKLPRHYTKFTHLSLFLATILHSILLHQWIDTPFGHNLSYWNMVSFSVWLMTIGIFFLSWFKPIFNLNLFIIPLSALSILFVAQWGENRITNDSLSVSTVIHILVSFASFSLIGIAGLQALLMNIQSYMLHHAKLSGILSVLPAYEDMEKCLFYIISLGFILFTVSMSFAFFHLEGISMILPKVIPAVAAWLLLAALLFSRIHIGLRGFVATRTTLLSVLLLTFSYFGTKVFLRF